MTSGFVDQRSIQLSYGRIGHNLTVISIRRNGLCTGRLARHLDADLTSFPILPFSSREERGRCVWPHSAARSERVVLVGLRNDPSDEASVGDVIPSRFPILLSSQSGIAGVSSDLMSPRLCSNLRR